MTFRELKDATLRALAENVTAPIAWTDDQVGRGLNEALSMFALMAGRPQGDASLTLIPGVTMVLVPTTLLHVLEIRLAGRLLTKGDVKALEAKRPGWLGDPPGTPREWFPIGRFRFGLYPRPSSALALTLRGILQPVDMAADADVPPLTVEDQEALVRYATYYGLLSGGEVDLDRALIIYGVPDQNGVTPRGSFMYYVAKTGQDQSRVQAVLPVEVGR